MITQLEIGEELANSDHKSISFSINLRNKTKENNVLLPNFRKVNFNWLNNALKRTINSFDPIQAAHLNADQKHTEQFFLRLGKCGI